MGEVVDLMPTAPLLWVCNCGCSTHRLHIDGNVECAACGATFSGEWCKALPEPSSPPREVSETKVISMAASPASALRTMMGRIDAESLVALIALQSNGRVRTWGGVDTLERVEWLERRLADARDQLVAFIDGRPNDR